MPGVIERKHCPLAFVAFRPHKTLRQRLNDRRRQMTRDEWQQQAAVMREQHDIRPLDIRYAEWHNAYMLHEAGAEYMAKAWLNRQSAAARKHYRARPRA